MKSYSQSGQDLFVHALLPKEKGQFLEIGCSHPFELSNTYALEQFGWSGIMLDNDVNAIELCYHKRRSAVILGDATTFNWSRLTFDPTIDYLSLDVDGATLDALKHLPLDRVRFNIATIENDMYRFGSGPRDAIREIMSRHGYHLIACNVHNDGLPFEEWFVGQELKEKAKRFESDGLDWKEIISRA